MTAARDTLYESRKVRGRRADHTLSVLVENKPGVLTRVAGLFARRAFNIESLAVGPTEDPKISRMTIALKAQTKPLSQVMMQLDKLINVIHVEELPHDHSVERELLLVKVTAGPGNRSQILEIAGIFRAKIVDVDPDALTLEATGTPDKLQALIDILRPYGIRETARTGLVALARGAQSLESVLRNVDEDEEESA